jgi:protein-L-isoaspartate O-methyltransferase
VHAATPPRRPAAGVKGAQPRIVFRGWSHLSGRIRVIDQGDERRLIVHGEILSMYPLDGDWRPLRREYWWKALEAVELPRRPAALLVGLGGGTQVHLLHRLSRPRSVTVIERDPVIVRVASAWFGLDRVRKLEIVCAEADDAVEGLTRAGRRFDYVMEDVTYADPPDVALPKLIAMVPLVAPQGSLVVNRHRKGDPRPLARTLRLYFGEVRLRRVRRTGENTLICCSRPRLTLAADA